MTVTLLDRNIVDEAVDTTPTAEGIKVREVNGAVRTFPYTAALDYGSAIIYENGAIEFDDGGDASGLPAAGATKRMGTFTVKVWDGALTQAVAADINVDVDGANTATAPSPFSVASLTVSTEASTNGDQIGIDVLSLPSDGGSAILEIKFKVNGGATQTLTGTGTGKRLVTVLAETLSSVEIWLTNAVGDSLTYTAPSVTPTKTGTGFPTAHTSVADASALNTLMNILEGDYDGTVAAYGGTAGQPFIIDLDSGAYDSATLSSRVFDHLVTIRATDQAGGATLSNTTLNDSSNMRLSHFAVTGSGSGRTFTIGGGCSNVQVEYTRVLCHPTAGQLSTGSVKYGCSVDRTVGGGARPVNCGFNHCDIQRAGSNLLFLRQCDNFSAVGNVFNHGGADDIQAKDCNIGLIDLMWGSTNHQNPSGAHMDGVQLTRDSTTLLGCNKITWSRSVIADWNNPTPTAKPYRQNIFGTIGHTNITINNVIVVGGNTNGVNVVGSGYDVQNCDFIFMRDIVNTWGTTHTGITGSASGTFNNNVERLNSGGKAGSLLLSYSAVDPASYEALYGDARVGGEAWECMGLGGDASELKPPSGADTHWSFGGTKKGAWSYKQEIFGGLYPKLWPVKDAFDYGHNQHARIAPH